MFVVLFMVALFRTFGASMPIIPNDMRINVHDLQTRAPVTIEGYRMRTRLDIIWSCISTLFICTWVAIHPNVPPRDEGHIWSFWRRMKLMLWTLVAPEMILLWAYKQWAAARYIAELFKGKHDILSCVLWTFPHHGRVQPRPGRSRNSVGLRILLRAPMFEEPFEFAFPTITAAEIHDKARGDFLSKGIVILQSIWFIVQCIARGKQGLALTELELVTLALASLNGVMYYFWWDKPLGVNESIKVYPIDTDPPKKIVKGEGRRERLNTPSEPSSTTSQVKPPVGFLVNPFQQLHYRLSIVTLSTIKKFIHGQREELKIFPGHRHLWVLYLPIYLSVGRLGISLMNIVDTTIPIRNAAYVPTFYAPHTDTLADIAGGLFLFVMPIIAAIFGALHLIAWRFHFPSHVEQLLWRIGSLAITTIPLSTSFLILIIVGIFYVCLKLIIIIWPSIIPPGVNFQEFSDRILDFPGNSIVWFIMGVAFVAYLPARLLLLIQAFVLLREQPESAFYAINWSHFLPHI